VYVLRSFAKIFIVAVLKATPQFFGNYDSTFAEFTKLESIASLELEPFGGR